MQRLLKKELPKTLSRAEAIFLAQVYDVDRNGFAVLCQQVINSPEVYTWMFTFFLEQKRLDVAYEITQWIQQDEAQLQALCDLAVAYSRLGDAEHETTMLSKAKHLTDLANAFAEKGDKVNFKRLHFPCSHFLDASYSMCVKLARLYPEQAAAIAEVVISLKNTEEELKESPNVN